jgi:hypothetical protein
MHAKLPKAKQFGNLNFIVVTSHRYIVQGSEYIRQLKIKSIN